MGRVGRRVVGGTVDSFVSSRCGVVIRDVVSVGSLGCGGVRIVVGSGSR